MIIGLTGYATSGKDSAAVGLVEDGWERVAFADSVREMALRIDPIVGDAVRLDHVVTTNGWTRAKEWWEVRDFLQSLGATVREFFGEDAWVELACQRISATHKNVVVTDCRYPNEFNLIHSLGGRLVRIDRPGVGPVNSHESESFIATAPVDAVLFNHGTEQELRDELRKMVRQFGFQVLDKTT